MMPGSKFKDKAVKPDSKTSSLLHRRRDSFEFHSFLVTKLWQRSKTVICPIRSRKS
jgi:hypothetical protein